MTRAMAEQSEATSSLARSADQVRRIAKQSARAVEEQADAATSIASIDAKASAGIAVMTKATAEQGATLEQATRAMEAMVAQVREVASAASQKGRRAGSVAQSAEEIAAELALLLQMSDAQLAAMSAATEMLRGNEHEEATHA
jgi:methyl-accepting chemotaxis protein